MTVSQETINAYYDGTVKKNIMIRFPDLGNLTMSNEDMDEEGITLEESLSEGDNFQIIGCVASRFSVSLYNLPQEVRGQKIVVTIKLEGINETINLFHGTVTDCTLSDDKSKKTIVAYDDLFRISTLNVASWYKDYPKNKTMKQFRDDLFAKIGIQQETTDLVNDRHVVGHPALGEEVNALDLIKSICQINGVFGIINRNGKFEYRKFITEETEDSYPGFSLFPAFYPGEEEEEIGNDDSLMNITYYKSIRYEDYKVRPMESLIIRDNEEDTGYGVIFGDNKYIIQGNIFTLGLSAEVKQDMADGIYYTTAYMDDADFIPFSAENMALPFVEVGLNKLAYRVRDARTHEIVVKNFIVLGRRLTGGQALMDNFYAEGDEFQNEFLLEIPIDLDQGGGMSEQEVEEIVSDYTYSKDNIDERIGAIERILGFTVAGGENITSLNLDGKLEETIVKTIREVE
ncbi:MAG: hypothetical protein Q4A15_01255 [Prevotellaceae bacterium]|nr:hypothetical protein [Prevotellaceae bacterium]